MTENILKQEIFVMEAASAAVTDTAYTKTVAGEHWFVNYINDTYRKTVLKILRYSKAEQSSNLETAIKLLPQKQ